MRQWIVIAAVAAGLGLLASLGQENRDAAYAAPIAPTGLNASGLQTHVQELEGKLLRVVVIDPGTRVMGVYDIERDTGEIQPKSIRNISADLQMLEFNSGAPSPADIQQSLQRK
jgi:hypothetical protein